MPRNPSLLGRWLAVPALALSLGAAGWAGSPSAPAPTPASHASPASPAKTAPASQDFPYGGLNSGLGAALDAGSGVGTANNPMAQAGRAFEALVVVLALVVGGMFLLKRSGLLKGGAAGVSGPASWGALLSKRPAASAGEAEGVTELLSLLGSQTLPGSPGAVLHLVSVGGRVLLLGATGQSVTLLTEVAEFALPSSPEAAETPEEAAAFAEYLAKVGVAAPTGLAAESTRASLSAATDRLQSLLSRGQE